MRGQVLPVVSLRELYSLDGEAPERSSVVVVQAGNQRYGVIVDQLLGQHQTVIKPLGRLFRSLRGMSGSSILGNGEVALIFDAASLSQMASAPPARGNAEPATPVSPRTSTNNPSPKDRQHDPAPHFLDRPPAGRRRTATGRAAARAGRRGGPRGGGTGPRRARAGRTAAGRTHRCRGHDAAVPRAARRGGDRAQGPHRDHEPHQHRLRGRQEGRHPQLQRQVRRGLQVQPQGADRQRPQHHPAPRHAERGVQADVVDHRPRATSSAAW
jgi:hypothetical protein